ncbi:DUF1129 domain-containing protein [Allofustis seminis]|uniref:DUF1129 domain-containing protein n=1 Tax=Allofustis seminis TaxID=166939 RepID=UPI000364F18C|nr:DUF1129 family protein [Allofustis seminis]
MKEQEEKQAQPTLSIAEENHLMYKKLTNKNEEYFFQLDRRLTEEGYPEDEREQILHEMLEKTMTLQEESVPARRHFGTVTDFLRKLRTGELAPEEESVASPIWQRYIDGALLLGGLFALINGVGAMNANALKYEPAGLGEILMNFVLGGVVMLIFTKYAPKPGKKNSFIIYFAASIGAMVIWVVGLGAMRYLALKIPAINPALPAWVIIAMGSFSLAGRFFFKRYFNIKGTLF